MSVLQKIDKSMHLRTVEDLESNSPLGLCWDDLVAKNPAGGFSQTTGWATFKRKMGLATLHQILYAGDRPVGGAICYMPARGNSPFIASVPHGPILPWADPDLAQTGLNMIVSGLKQYAQNNRLIGLRIEPNLPPPVPQVLRGFSRASLELLPEETLLIDLTKPVDTLLSEMHPKCRYNIKVAARHGVQIVEDTSLSADGLREFHQLLCQAALRDDFRAEPLIFFKNLCQTLSTQSVKLFFAVHEQERLGALLLLKSGSRATYLYGGISNQKRHMMSGYALQWQAIQAAQKWGCLTYDFYGYVSPAEVQHPYARFSRFKEHFGGYRERTFGAQDLILTDRLAEVVVEAMLQL
jgi:lipid II:glycine glycyltransferase (peptidoglycan interpeptide bridge formation enzyme)